MLMFYFLMFISIVFFTKIYFIGITESYLSLARQMIGQGRDITALSYLNVAIQKLINALNEKSV